MGYTWASTAYHSMDERNMVCMHDWLTACGRTSLRAALASDDAAILSKIDASDDAREWFVFDEDGNDCMNDHDKLVALSWLRELAEEGRD